MKIEWRGRVMMKDSREFSLKLQRKQRPHIEKLILFLQRVEHNEKYFHQFEDLSLIQLKLIEHHFLLRFLELFLNVSIKFVRMTRDSRLNNREKKDRQNRRQRSQVISRLDRRKILIRLKILQLSEADDE